MIQMVWVCGPCGMWSTKPGTEVTWGNVAGSFPDTVGIRRMFVICFKAFHNSAYW